HPAAAMTILRAAQSRLLYPKCQKHGTFVDLLTLAHLDGFHRPVAGRNECELHFHRLHDDKRIALGYHRSRTRAHDLHKARHRSDQPVAISHIARTEIEWISEVEDMRSVVDADHQVMRR